MSLGITNGELPRSNKVSELSTIKKVGSLVLEEMHFSLFFTEGNDMKVYEEAAKVTRRDAAEAVASG